MLEITFRAKSMIEKFMKPLGKTKFSIHRDHFISSSQGKAQHVLFSNLACSPPHRGKLCSEGNTAEQHSYQAVCLSVLSKSVDGNPLICGFLIRTPDHRTRRISFNVKNKGV